MSLKAARRSGGNSMKIDKLLSDLFFRLLPRFPRSTSSTTCVGVTGPISAPRFSEPLVARASLPLLYPPGTARKGGPSRFVEESHGKNTAVGLPWRARFRCSPTYVFANGIAQGPPPVCSTQFAGQPRNLSLSWRQQRQGRGFKSGARYDRVQKNLMALAIGLERRDDVVLRAA